MNRHVPVDREPGTSIHQGEGVPVRVKRRRPVSSARPGRSRLGLFLQVLLLPVVLIAWELIARAEVIHPILLPRFSAVVGMFIEFLSSDFFREHIVRTLSEIFIGYLIGCGVGIMLGLLLSAFPVLRSTYLPLISAFSAIPAVVLAPVVITWFGFGIASKIVLAALVCFFPVFLSTLAGLLMVSELELRFMESLRASRWQIFIRLRLPTAIPAMFGGLKIAMTLATVGAIVAEFVGTDAGLGLLLLRYRAAYDIPAVFALIVLFGLIGTLSFFIIEWLERRIAFWRT